MLKNIIVLCIILFSCNCHAQKVEVLYKSYSVKDFTETELEEMDPRKRQMVQKMRDDINAMEYILKVDQLTSEFTTVFKLPSPGRSNMMAEIENEQVFYNSPKKFIEKSNSMGSVVLIEGTPYQIEWKISKESKIILDYECYLATSSIIQSNNTILNIEAWFAPSLPYSFGPKAFYGLPGLILETVQNKGIILRADRITLDADVYITEPSGFKKLSRESHNKQTQKLHEMMMSRIKN